MYISSASDAIMPGYNGIALNYRGSSMVAHQTVEIAVPVFESVISHNEKNPPVSQGSLCNTVNIFPRYNSKRRTNKNPPMFFRILNFVAVNHQ